MSGSMKHDDEAYVLGYNGLDNGNITNDKSISFTTAGKPVAGGTVAVSARLEGQDGLGDNTYEGCINTVTSVVDINDSLNCSGTSVPE